MRRILLSLLLAGGSATVFAADNGFYLGGSLGNAGIEIEEQSLRFDGDDTAYKLIAGLRPLDWLGLEVSYVDFGNPDDRLGPVSVEADANGLSAFALGFLPVGPVDLFVKGGFVNWDATLRSPALSVDADGTDLAWGGGVQFRLGSLALRGEYEVFDLDDLDEVNLLSIGLLWTFL